MRAFFHELKRRRVYRVALTYGIFASAMIQVGGENEALSAQVSLGDAAEKTRGELRHTEPR
jgi:hypothetical protein